MGLCLKVSSHLTIANVHKAVASQTFFSVSDKHNMRRKTASLKFQNMWPVTWQNLILRYFFIPLHDDKWNIILIEKECLNFSNYPTEPNFFTYLKQKLTKSTNNSNLNFGASEGDKYKRYIIEWEYKSNNFF